MTVLEIVVRMVELEEERLRMVNEGHHAAAQRVAHMFNHYLNKLMSLGLSKEALNHVCFHCGGNGHGTIP